MAKKKKHPEHENLERWLVSYADFITLLFATFTALYALAQSDLSKLKDVSAAVREGFQEQSIMSGIKSIMQGKSAPNDNPNPLSKDKGAGAGVIGKYESLTYSPGEVKKAEKTYKNLKQDVEQINDRIKQDNKKEAQKKPPPAKGTKDEGTHAPSLPAKKDTEAPTKGIDVAIQERGLRVSFDSRLLFEPGTAVLKKESEKDLDIIAQRLYDYNSGYVIHVEGHTDDQPIASAIYPSNWELSAARASTVVRYLIRKHGYSAKSLVAVGYGDSHPISTNLTPEGRRANRRVDIIIYSKKVGDEVNPSTQFVKEGDLIKSVPSDLLHSEERDEHNNVINSNAPVKVIIQGQDGSERVIIPKSKQVVNPGVSPNLTPSVRVAPTKPGER